MPFQSNSTLQTALWMYTPDQNDKVGQRIVINLNRVQYIEIANDNSRVYIYYDMTSVSTTQSPYELKGAVAAAFIADLSAIFA